MSKRRADVEVDSPSQVAPEPRADDPQPTPTVIVEGALERAFAAPAVVRTNPITGTINAEDLAQVIKNVLHDELGHMIADVERRLKMAYEVEAGGRQAIHAPDLNLNRHFIEGYTVTANSPTGGSIAWTNVNIVYNGTNYALTNGNTALKYTWFAMGTPTVLQSSNTQPVLATGDTLVFVNNAGTPTSVLEGAGGIAPAVGPASVTDAAIVGVTAAKVSGVLADGNIPSLAASKITSGTFGTGQIPNLDAAKITTGAFATAQIPNLDAAKITTGALGTAQIPSLDAGKITTGAFADARIPSLDASKVTTGTFGNARIGAGAIAPVNLNVLQHVLY